jgi:hypothetical protein
LLGRAARASQLVQQLGDVVDRCRGETGVVAAQVAADQRQPLTPRLREVEADRTEAQPAAVAPADHVLAVRLAVEAPPDTKLTES